MRIGIDCRTILSPEAGEKAGVGHYTYYLVKYLLKIDKRNQYVLFFDHRSTTVKDFRRRNSTIVRFPFSEYKRYLPYAYSHVFVSSFLQRAGLDVFHSPANVIPLQYNKPAVVTVHDLAIYRHPEWFPPQQDFSVNVLVPKSLRKAQHIIAVSHSTAQDIKRWFYIPASHITVIHEGYEPLPLPSKLSIYHVLKRFHLNDTYLLYLGTLEPRKNIAGLIAAFDYLATRQPKRYQSVQLVLAGAKGYHFEENYRAIQEAKSGQIRYVGYVTAVEKQALLFGALGFVWPSLYEGFGLPVLEAQVVGVPVITSAVASLPEVVGKGALLIKPTSQLALQRAISRVVTDKRLRHRLITQGRRNAKKFSWLKTAQQTLNVYQHVGR